MTDEDATFEDGAYADQPLKLAAETADDLTVLSALVQDAVGVTKEISWMPRRHRLVMLVNRLRREDRAEAGGARRVPERVRSAIVCDTVLKVRARGLDPREAETVFAILSASYAAGEDGGGTLVFTLAGDGELALDVEALDMRLVDLTRPWQTGREPEHGADD